MDARDRWITAHHDYLTGGDIVMAEFLKYQIDRMRPLTPSIVAVAFGPFLGRASLWHHLYCYKFFATFLF